MGEDEPHQSSPRGKGIFDANLSRHFLKEDEHDERNV
jgi:hypothetical protein